MNRMGRLIIAVTSALWTIPAIYLAGIVTKSDLQLLLNNPGILALIIIPISIGYGMFESFRHVAEGEQH